MSSPKERRVKYAHVLGSDRLNGWEEQDHADEADPADRYSVDWFAPFTECERSRDELDSVLVDAMGEYDGDIGEIKSRSGDVEDRDHRLRGTDSD